MNRFIGQFSLLSVMSVCDYVCMSPRVFFESLITPKRLEVELIKGFKSQRTLKLQVTTILLKKVDFASHLFG